MIKNKASGPTIKKTTKNLNKKTVVQYNTTKHRFLISRSVRILLFDDNSDWVKLTLADFAEHIILYQTL
jgi:hypothetical protein